MRDRNRGWLDDEETEPVEAGYVTRSEVRIPDPVRRRQTIAPGMACRRPGVRVPLAPLQVNRYNSNTEPVTGPLLRGNTRGRFRHRQVPGLQEVGDQSLPSRCNAWWWARGHEFGVPLPPGLSGGNHQHPARSSRSSGYWPRRVTVAAQEARPRRRCQTSVTAHAC